MAISWSTSQLPSIHTTPSPETKVAMFSEKKNDFITQSLSHSPLHQRKPSHQQASNFTLRNPFYNFICKLWDNLCGIGKDYDPKDIEGNGSSTISDTDDEVSYLRRSPHSGLISGAYFPMRLTLMLLGRWPFLLILKSITPLPPAVNHKKTYHSKLLHRIRVLNYDSSLKSPIWLYFGLTTLFICFVLVMSTLGFFDFFLEWRLLPNCRWATIQKNTFRNNLVMFLLVWGCLLHSTLSSIAMFINRRKVARTLNFWNVAAEELKIGNVRNHRRFLIVANLGYVLFLVLIYFAYSWWNIRFVRDGATLFGTLAIRPLLNEEQLNNTEEWKLRVFGIVMIIYCVYASRAFLFIFCFKCRLLRHLFHGWNQRLVAYLHRSPGDGIEYEKLEKVTIQRLLRDMTILLKMVKQMDAMFATVLLSYYSIQLLNMCFELYMLAKSGTKEFTNGSASNRSLDIMSALITLGQNVYFFFTVSLDGAGVGEEAAEGLETLRRHHITPRSSVHKKYLVYNLTLVYQQRIVLTGGKFFVLDRPFIITVLGSVITYFIIILQVEPSLQKDTEEGGVVGQMVTMSVA